MVSHSKRRGVMQWSPQQDAALQAVSAWLRDGDQQVFRLFGFAGVGKTMLAKHFGEGIDGRVLYAAFTGKAAYVLRSMGCPDASTIHSLIYHSKDKSRSSLHDLENSLVELRGELRFEYKQENKNDDISKDALTDMVEQHRRVQDIKKLITVEREALARPSFILNPDSVLRDANLLVIDECSMVDGRMGDDVLSFGTKVLVLGDPAQLPPIGGAGFFTEGIEPDFMLTEIHRQARENPIIAMATQVRQEKALEVGSYGDSMVADKANIDHTHAEAADQILVGKNVTRHASNRRMRALLGTTEALPILGDKLVCLRNNHELGLLNGALWHVEDVGMIEDDRIYMTLRPDIEGNNLDVEAHTHHFLGTEGTLHWTERKNAEEFDFGYALTVHKAQGSQFDNVLLFDESYCFRKDKWKWLYTGLTRAAKMVTVVRM